MSEGFCPLASGSKGNSLFVGTKKTKILIDAGLSARATESRLNEIGVDLRDIQAIVITHEHTDHIAGLKTLGARLGIPILANRETAKGICAALQDRPRFKIFATGEDFVFGDITFHPFSVQHDTPDPVAFTLRIDGLKLGVCTDLGFATTLVQKNLQDCDYLYIEANHEPSMVHASARPLIYKHRVLGKSGHLSNEESAHLIFECLGPKLKHIHLAHLSQECNSPITAVERVREKIGEGFPLSIAFQEKISERVHF